MPWELLLPLNRRNRVCYTVVQSPCWQTAGLRLRPRCVRIQSPHLEPLCESMFLAGCTLDGLYPAYSVDRGSDRPTVSFCSNHPRSGNLSHSLSPLPRVPITKPTISSFLLIFEQFASFRVGQTFTLVQGF